MVVKIVGMRLVVAEEEKDKGEEGRDGGVAEGRARFRHYGSWL